jgi:hypothetical protein
VKVAVTVAATCWRLPVGAGFRSRSSTSRSSPWWWRATRGRSWPERVGHIRDRESGRAGDLFVEAILVIVGSVIVTAAVTFVLYVLLWVLDKVEI